MGKPNLVGGAEEGSPPSVTSKEEEPSAQQQMVNAATVPGSVTVSQSSEPTAARKRKLRRTLDPLTAEIIELPPSALLASHNFVCRVCSKSFQREQNLQLHMRGHKLPWKLKMRSITEDRNRIYVCPEATCQRHNPAFGLGDFPGIRKHFCRKHGERKWKCGKCPKAYAVHCDWKAHTKICGQKKYKCHCGSSYARKVSFMAHIRSCRGPIMKEEDEVNKQEEPPYEGNLQHTEPKSGEGAGGSGSGFQMPDLNHDTGYATGSKFKVLDLNHQTGNPHVASSDDHMAISRMNMEDRYLASSRSLFGQTSFNPYSLDLHLGSNGMTSFRYMNYDDGSSSGSGGGGGVGGFYKLELASMQTMAQMDVISSNNSTSLQMLQENSFSAISCSDSNPIYNNWPYAGSNTDHQMTSSDQLTHQTSQERYYQIPARPFEDGDEYCSTQLPQNQTAGFPYQYYDNVTAADDLLLHYDFGMHSCSTAPWLPMDSEHRFHENMAFENTDELQNQNLNMGIQGVHQFAQTGGSMQGFTWDGIGIKPQTGDGMGIDFSEIRPEPWMVHGEYQHQQLPIEFDHGNQEELQSKQLPHSNPSIEKGP